MSELRDQLEAARVAYAGERYSGDLGDVALRRWPRRRRVARSVIAVAAAAAIAIALLPEEASDSEADRPALAAMTASPLAMNHETDWLTRSKRVNKYRGAAKRVATLLAQREAGVIGQRPWASPLGFARPKPPAAAPPGALTPADSTPTKRRAKTVPSTITRPLSLSPPSLAVRSLNHAISVGS